MSNTTVTVPENNQEHREPWRPARIHLLWAIALAAFLPLWLFGKPFADWAFKYPRGEQIPFQQLDRRFHEVARG